MRKPPRDRRLNRFEGSILIAAALVALPNAVKSAFFLTPWWWRVVSGLTVTAACYAFIAGRRSFRRGATAAKDKSSDPPVVFLRPFGLDGAKIQHRRPGPPPYSMVVHSEFEKVLIDGLRALGPLVALGRPEDIAPAGPIPRDYYYSEDWKARMTAELSSSKIVVLAVGAGSSLEWEIKAIFSLGIINKVILVRGPDPTSWFFTPRHLLHLRPDDPLFVQPVLMLAERFPSLLPDLSPDTLVVEFESPGDVRFHRGHGYAEDYAEILKRVVERRARETNLPVPQVDPAVMSQIPAAAPPKRSFIRGASVATVTAVILAGYLMCSPFSVLLAPRTFVDAGYIPDPDLQRALKTMNLGSGPPEDLGLQNAVMSELGLDPLGDALRGRPTAQMSILEALVDDSGECRVLNTRTLEVQAKPHDLYSLVYAGLVHHRGETIRIRFHETCASIARARRRH